MIEIRDSNGDRWIEFFFSKKFTMMNIDSPISDIITNAIRFGAPEYYLASLAFSLEGNGCAGLAKKIIDAAKNKYPAFPFEKIPTLAKEDREALAEGVEPKDVIEKRRNEIFQMFNN
jgi:hypothetical protein